MRKILLLLLTMMCWNLSCAETTESVMDQMAWGKHWDLLRFVNEFDDAIGFSKHREEIGSRLSLTRMKDVLINLEHVGEKFMENEDLENLNKVIEILQNPNDAFQTEGAYESFYDYNKQWEVEGYIMFATEVNIFANIQLSTLKNAHNHKKIRRS